MKSRTLIIAITGVVAALFAVILNLAQGADASAQRTLAIEAIVAGVIALGCAVYCVRKGGNWRWWAIAAAGPALFAMTDAGIRVLFLR